MTWTTRRVLGVALTTTVTTAVALLPQLPGPATAAPAHGDHHRIHRSLLGSTVSWDYAVNNRGVGYAAWIEGGSRVRQLWVARRAPDGQWSKAKAITGRFRWTGPRTWAGYPDVVVDRRGRATVVWAHPRGRHVGVRVMTSSPTGAWHRPRFVSGKGEDAAFPRVAVSDAGSAVVTWARSNDEGTTAALVAAYRRPSGRWTTPTRLDGEPGYPLDARPGAPAIDARGVASVVWDEQAPAPGAGRLRVASRSATADWSTTTLEESTPAADNPLVATTRDGRLVAAWRTPDGFRARHRAPDGTWGPTVLAAAHAPGYGGTLWDLGIGRAGRAVLYAESVRHADSVVQPVVLTETADPLAPWQRDEVDAPVRLYFAFDPFQPSLAVGARGDVTVTWHEQQPTTTRWAWVGLRHRTASGQWLPVERVGRITADPVVASDGRGRVSVVYGDGYRHHGQDHCCVRLYGGKVRSR